QRTAPRHRLQRTLVDRADHRTELIAREPVITRESRLLAPRELEWQFRRRLSAHLCVSPAIYKQEGSDDPSPDWPRRSDTRRPGRKMKPWRERIRGLLTFPAEPAELVHTRHIRPSPMIGRPVVCMQSDYPPENL